MFVKVTTSGPRRYVQLVESFRDEAGLVKKRIRTVQELLGFWGQSPNSPSLRLAHRVQRKAPRVIGV